MQIVIGPFHPSLEDAWVAEVRRLKTADPLFPLLVLVPSKQIRRRLQVVLTLEQDLSLVRISILTFHQLSKRLCQEHAPSGDFSTQRGLFFEEYLRLLIRRGAAADPFLAKIEETEGGAAALWQSLRDLKDGLVDPDVVQNALQEGQFGPGAAQSLGPLFDLYRRMEEGCKAAGLLTYGDLAALATRLAPESLFLKGFGRVLYYGFYDLTQVQIDLFQTVARHYETTVFFPLVRGHSAWDFAKHFFARHVEGLVRDARQVTELCAEGPPARRLFDNGEDSPWIPGPGLALFNCYDMRDEVLCAAKKILRLTQDAGVGFHEIALVAREVETYLPDILSLFEDHAIPMTTQAEVPLIQYPYAKNVLLLLTLRLKDYPRAHCIDLLSSPDFEAQRFCAQGNTADADQGKIVPRKDQWDALSRQAGVVKGLEAWQALKRPGLSAPGQAALLLNTVSALAADLEAFPSEAAWSDYALRFQGLLEKYLGFAPPEEGAQDLAHGDPVQDPRVLGAVADLFESISGLDRIAPRVSLEDFAETFSRWMARKTIPAAGPANAGVTVLGAMAARGLSYPYLFLLGMNEGRFPRGIREDPFLPDAHRRVLETVLGYKVGEKLAAYDEERLLLSLLVDGARKGLTAFYHRVDTEGSATSPTWALRRIAQALRPAHREVVEHIVPRGFQEREALSLFSRFDFLPPGEAALRLALSGFDADVVLGAIPLPAVLYRKGRAALRRIESAGALTAFDGLTGPPDPLPEQGENALTPTALERYALCPFQYFAVDLLNLSPIERPEDRSELPSSELGILCHAILHRFYSELHRDGYFADGRQEIEWTQRFEKTSAAVFAEHESEHPVAYPLFWEEKKAQIGTFLAEAIAIDFKQLSSSGFRPAGFELNCRGKIETAWPELRGRIDRLDVNPETKAVRAVDYKITFRRQAKPLEKNLVLSALRGERLQAPIYQRLAAVYGEEGGGLSAAFYYLAPNWSDGPLVVREFTENAWAGETGSLLKETIGALFSGMAAGHFFMNPDVHCRYCPASPICRKEHLPSRRRLERDPLWTRLRLRLKKNLPSNKKESA